MDIRVASEEPMNRSRDWLEQAKRDLEHARQSIGLGHFEWACFASQ